MRITLGAIAVWVGLTLSNPEQATAQEKPLPTGFQTVDGKYIRLVTDLPVDDDLRQLPAIFDAAMPQWCERFSMELDEVADWKATAYVMLDRARFRQVGLIPPEVPNFPFGFQYRNDLWVTEQPSPYYRRHLLLHEGTHWFMQRKYGAAGPPWIMEGMAEWLGTHRWEGELLTMGIIPTDKQDVPYWGRITLIQQQLQQGQAPSLEAILRYDNTAHQRVDAYAWSWAAVVFLQHHPETRRIFKALLLQPMRNDSSMTRWLFARLRGRWPELRQEWNAFLTDLEYGYNSAHEMLVLKPHQASELASLPIVFELAADQGWQSTGIRIESPTTVQIECKGRFGVGSEPDVWISEPAGVTLEYYHGQPLGRVIMTTIATIPKEPEHSQPLTVVSVGSGGEYLLEPGELFLRVNESIAGLADNSGIITVTITP